MTTEEKLTKALEALQRIAAFQDEIGNAGLVGQPGYYGFFDEPHSVRVARETLKELGIHG